MVLFTLMIPMYVSIGVTENILVILSTPLESLDHFHNNQQPLISINFSTTTLYKLEHNKTISQLIPNIYHVVLCHS